MRIGQSKHQRATTRRVQSDQNMMIPEVSGIYVNFSFEVSSYFGQAVIEFEVRISNTFHRHQPTPSNEFQHFSQNVEYALVRSLEDSKQSNQKKGLISLLRPFGV